MARKPRGTEKREARSIRIEPSVKEKIERTYGSLQKWFDRKLADEFKSEKSKKEKEEISAADF